ncbi:MAG: polyprenol monophosphomannose synthase [Rubricoccaceae bacterium]|nr:polyprenol monophosphomannose synthase [Rubricoccaceae bacterium]
MEPSPPTIPPADRSATRAVVIIPTYNEAQNVPALLRQVMELPGEIAATVVDDGSPDGTAALVRQLMDEYPGRIGLIERPGKLGLGTAYLAGFERALAADYDYVCEMDADFSHNPRDLPLLIEACRTGADLAIGSRYADGVRVVNWPLSRLILSYGAGVYTRAITRLPVQDVTAGFKCFRRRVLEALDLDGVRSNGYSFQIEMTYRAWRRGFRIVEVPIVFTERAEGQSKMSRAIVREAMRKVWELRWLDLRGRL